MDWVVFTSAHAVDACCDHAEWRRAVDGRRDSAPRRRRTSHGRAPCRVRASSPTRAGRGRRVVARRPRSSTRTGTLAGARVLWPRADIARRDAGARARHERAPSWSRPSRIARSRCRLRIAGVARDGDRARGQLDAIVFCSPSSAEHLARDAGSRRPRVRSSENLLVASIGPTTTAALAALGAPPHVEAATPSTAAAGHGARRAPALRSGETRVSFPQQRPRRLRRTETIRRLVRETRLSPDNLVAPLFVCTGEGVRREIAAMPGCYQLSPDLIVEEARELAALGVPAVILFGIPDHKDADGTAAADRRGSGAAALTALRGEFPGALALGRRVPVRVHRPRPLRADRDGRATGSPKSATTRRCRGWRPPRWPTRRPARTSSRRRT